MAKKKFDLEKVLMAAGGGVGARVIQGLAHKFLPANMATPLIDAGGIAVVGAGIQYFAPKYDDVGAGMVGVAGYLASGMMLDGMLPVTPMQGTNRVLGAADKARLAKFQRLTENMKLRPALPGHKDLRATVASVAAAARGGNRPANNNLRCGPGSETVQSQARPAYAEVRPSGYKNKSRYYYC